MSGSTRMGSFASATHSAGTVMVTRPSFHASSRGRRRPAASTATACDSVIISFP
jgi:hypothetical protein